MSTICAKELYVGLKNEVKKITLENWENQVNKSRNKKAVWIIHFYKDNDGHSAGFEAEYIKEAEKLNGIIKFAHVDCNNQPMVCDKQGVQKFPTFKIYPPVPIPAIEYQGELSAKAMTNQATQYVQSVVQEITDDSIEGFSTSNPAVPKVYLFTDKKTGVPLMWKAMSLAFENKMALSIVRSDQKDVVQKFNIKKFPTILLTKASDRKPFIYDGDLKYIDIFEWCNIYSEQFVFGGGSSAEGSGAAPWLNEAVPELFNKSAKDVCLGVYFF